MSRLFLPAALAVVGICAPTARAALIPVPDRIDLDDLRQGEHRAISVALKNTGDKEVEITVAQATCTCTQISLTSKKIPPGQSATLSAVVTRTDAGAFRGSILLRNSQSPVPLQIAVNGTAKQMYQITAAWAEKGASGGNDADPGKLPPVRAGSASLDLYIRGIDPAASLPGGAELKQITIASRTFALESAQVEPHATTAPATASSALRLRLVSKSPLTEGLHQGNVTVRFGESIELQPFVSFRVLGPVWAAESSINFGAIRPAAGPVQRDVLVHFQPDVTPWTRAQILGVSPDTFAPAVSITRQDPKDGALLVRTAVDGSKLPTGRSKDGFFRFTIRLGQGDQAVDLNAYGMMP